MKPRTLLAVVLLVSGLFDLLGGLYAVFDWRGASALIAQTSYDLLLQGGRVIDPKNSIDARMDVAIANGKIARVAANIPASEARRVVSVAAYWLRRD